MSNAELLDVSENRENYITKIGGKDISVFLIKKEINNSIYKYIMLKCKKKEIQKNSKELSIFHYNELKYDIPLNDNNYIIEIKKKDYTSFIRLFDEILIDTDEFTNIDSLDQNNKILISELDKIEKSREKNEKIIECIKEKKILIIFGVFALVVIFAAIIFGLIYYSQSEKKTTEEDDDNNILKSLIFIREINNKYKNEEKIKIFYKNGNIKYKGSLKNYFADGKGTYYSEKYNGTILYEGNFKKGYASGNGIRHYYEGNKRTGLYKGSWIQSKRDGRGEMHNYTEGSIYIGLWTDDKRNGKGIFNLTKDDDYYIGEFKDNERYGKGRGKIHYSNGDYYEGEFYNGLNNGSGILYYKNGKIFFL